MLVPGTVSEGEVGILVLLARLSDGSLERHILVILGLEVLVVRSRVLYRGGGCSGRFWFGGRVG